MKILFISDTHGQHRQLKNQPHADLIIHGGDCTRMGKDHEAEDFMRWFTALDYAHKVFIAGNHDFFFEGETPKSIKRFLTNNTYYLFNSSVIINGVKIWGSPYTPTFFNWAFNLDRGGEIAEMWRLIPSDTDILVTHGPPYGILDEVEVGLHVGCEELLEKVKQVQPKFHLFGHIHEQYGHVENGKITFINGSVPDESYVLKNKPVLFEF